MTAFYDFIEMSQHLPLVYLAVGVYLVQWILSHPDEWMQFLSSLDTNGGHIVSLVAILIIGYRMFQSDATAGGQLITGAEAALFILLNSKRPTRAGDPPPDAPNVSTASVSVTTSGAAPPATPPMPAAPEG